jgi:hypothetical protein
MVRARTDVGVLLAADYCRHECLCATTLANESSVSESLASTLSDTSEATATDASDIKYFQVKHMQSKFDGSGAGQRRAEYLGESKVCTSGHLFPHRNRHASGNYRVLTGEAYDDVVPLTETT